MLYAAVDQSIKNNLKSSGINSQTELFDVTLVLAYRDSVARSFDYTSCRIVDYIVKTEHDLEEIFYKGFTLTNEFYFECLGYAPSNPVYDALSEISKANTRSSVDWESEQCQSWGPNFRSS